MLLVASHIVLTSDKKPCFGSLDNLFPLFEEMGVKYLTQKEVLSMNPAKILIKVFKVVWMIYQNPTAKVFIGADPINTFAGLLGKFFFNKSLKVIFYSVDYSTSRSGNPILDWMYVKLDEFDARNSFETWSCSSRVINLRSRYLPSQKNFFFPNYPTFEVPKLSKFDRFTLLFIGFLNPTYHLEWLEKIMERVSQDNKIQLIVIGNGDKSEKISQKYLELQRPDNISILGFLSRDKVIEYLSKSHVGLALYSGYSTFNEFGDSMKVREYTHSLLPTITTGIISNAWEIEKFQLGLVVNNYEELVNAIEKLLDPKHYETYQKNCEKYKKSFVVKDFLKQRLSTIVDFN